MTTGNKRQRSCTAEKLAEQQQATSVLTSQQQVHWLFRQKLPESAQLQLAKLLDHDDRVCLSSTIAGTPAGRQFVRLQFEYCSIKTACDDVAHYLVSRDYDTLTRLFTQHCKTYHVAALEVAKHLLWRDALLSRFSWLSTSPEKGLQLLVAVGPALDRWARDGNPRLIQKFKIDLFAQLTCELDDDSSDDDDDDDEDEEAEDEKHTKRAVDRLRRGYTLVLQLVDAGFFKLQQLGDRMKGAEVVLHRLIDYFEPERIDLKQGQQLQQQAPNPEHLFAARLALSRFAFDRSHVRLHIWRYFVCNWGERDVYQDDAFFSRLVQWHAYLIHTLGWPGPSDSQRGYGRVRAAERKLWRSKDYYRRVAELPRPRRGRRRRRRPELYTDASLPQDETLLFDVVFDGTDTMAQAGVIKLLDFVVDVLEPEYLTTRIGRSHVFANTHKREGDLCLLPWQTHLYQRLEKACSSPGELLRAHYRRIVALSPFAATSMLSMFQQAPIASTLTTKNIRDLACFMYRRLLLIFSEKPATSDADATDHDNPTACASLLVISLRDRVCSANQCHTVWRMEHGSAATTHSRLAAD